MAFSNQNNHPIPGPKGLPILGSLLDFRRDPANFLLQTALTYGDVVRLQMGPKEFYLINNADYVHQMLVTHQHNFLRIGPGVLLRRGRGLLGIDFRNYVQPVVPRNVRRSRVKGLKDHHQLATYAPFVTEYTERLLGEWRDGQDYDIHSEMGRLTLTLTSKNLFGADLYDNAEEIGDAATEVMLWVLKRIVSFVSLPESLPLPSVRRYQRAAALLDSTIQNMINARRTNTEPMDDFLALLLRAQAEGNGAEVLTNQAILDEVKSMFLAAWLATVNALSWTWYLLSTYPAARVKMEAELDDVLGGRAPTAADAAKLKYLETVIFEAMRLYPPLWAYGRLLDQRWEFGEYAIPAGSIVLLSPYVMHHHPKYWDNPEGFEPDRFSRAMQRRRPHFAYFPFGRGRHRCPGEPFALLEMKLTLATIAQRFRLNLRPGHPIEAFPIISLGPKHGLPMTVHRRQ